MKWIIACIKNKLLVYILTLTICFLGLFCLYVVPISPFPEIKMNMMNIQFNYAGANAQTVQSQMGAFDLKRHHNTVNSIN